MRKFMSMGLLIILSFLVLGQKCEAIEYSEVVATQLMVEKTLEERVQSVLTKILGPNRARVVIAIEPNVERSMTEIETWAEQKSKEEEEKGKAKDRGPGTPPKVKELLPGIPLKKSVLERGEEVAPTSEAKKEAAGMKKRVESIVKLPPSFIKRITTTLIIDRKVSDALVETVQSVVTDLLNLEPKRGDRLIIRRVSFIPATPWWSFIFKPQTYWVIIGILITVTLFMFLFGPLKTFFQNLLNTMKELKGARTEIESASSSALGGGAAAGLVTVEQGFPQRAEGKTSGEVEGEEGEIPQTFRFVKESNLKRLLYLIKNEPPEGMALILSYLTPDQAAKVLCSLSSELQLRVALNLTMVKQMDEKIVNRVEKNIREKIDLLKGGVDEFVEIFDRLDKNSKENILKALEKKNPKLAKKIKDLTFSFEQVTTIDNSQLRIILGEINTGDLAIALRRASEEVKSRIMENMSAGGAALLKEEMEFGKPVTIQAIEEQQQKMVDLILKLEREGKIELKGRKRRGEIEKIEELQDIKKIIEEETIRKRLEEEPEEAVQPITKSKASEKTDNEKAFEHYNAGMEASKAGRYEEAIREFKTSLQYNDRIWQTYQYLGSCYYNQGMEEEAVQAYKKALELNPDNRELSEWLNNRK
ncbi:tetratricopeptide repeat protein [bacterium]|nr:tetratricopeptide repeat protein [bacterium]NIN91881.1 tetratricopeptide repeat protein [bacterium]NIO18147.1 tetratricopeptide repeat protein [bacterium]NIO73122.1 tetratricopeptide repeat protein [bacterium]